MFTMSKTETESNLLFLKFQALKSQFDLIVSEIERIADNKNREISTDQIFSASITFFENKSKEKNSLYRSRKMTNHMMQAENSDLLFASIVEALCVSAFCNQ